MSDVKPPSRRHFPSTIQQYAVAVIALAFLALHLPYLPSSLEDLDSINFALGVRTFDVAHHQPHPPGYPVFIGMAKVARLVSRSEARALGSIGILAGGMRLMVC